MFLKISQNLLQFRKIYLYEACNFIEKVTLAQVFSCTFYESFLEDLFRTSSVTASALLQFYLQFFSSSQRSYSHLTLYLQIVIKRWTKKIIKPPLNLKQCRTPWKGVTNFQLQAFPKGKHIKGHLIPNFFYVCLVLKIDCFYPVVTRCQIFSVSITWFKKVVSIWPEAFLQKCS